MKIGLYFGSFNPIHIGHLIIANHVINTNIVQKIWFIVSPQNPLKHSNSLLNEYQRLFLVNLAIEDNSNFKASDVEFKLPKPSYTIDTLTYLKEKYPEHDFYIIMGSDSYSNIPKWKNYERLLNQNHVLIYERPGFDITGLHKNVTVMQKVSLLEISATQIRNLIKAGKSARYLMPDRVLEEIEKSRFFR